MRKLRNEEEDNAETKRMWENQEIRDRQNETIVKLENQKIKKWENENNNENKWRQWEKKIGKN